jgi:hypothetical protein
MTVSVLDGVPGLGPTRKKRLLAELGGIKNVRQAPREALGSLSWLPQPVAEAVWEKIHGDTGAGSALRAARRAVADKATAMSDGA